MTYTIKIHNNSGHDHPYVVFMPPSQTQPTSEPPQVYNNAWRTFDNITDGGWDGGPLTGPSAFQVAAVADGQPIGTPALVDFGGRSETTVNLVHGPEGWTVSYL